MNKEKRTDRQTNRSLLSEDMVMVTIPPFLASQPLRWEKSKLLIKEAGVLAGIEVKKSSTVSTPTMKVEVFINDGTEVKPGDTIAMVVEGLMQSLLRPKRLMLNDAAYERYRHHDPQQLKALTPVCWRPQDNASDAYSRKDGCQNRWRRSQPSYRLETGYDPAER